MKDHTFVQVLGAVIAAFCLFEMQVQGAEDVTIGDFAGPDYGAWKSTGTAFQKGPQSSAALEALRIEGAKGAGVATSKVEGDAPIGTLTSPTFKIERPYISFLISGGAGQHDNCLNLLVGGAVVKSATAADNDRLEPDAWDVSPFQGKEAQIQIVDNAPDKWGHLNVARIVQTEHPDRMPMAKAPLYQEALRPQFHFTARQWTVDKPNPQHRDEGWLNDPNGLIYYDHEYHLFSQRWNKCWIHAVSPDMVHWTELEPAFWEPVQGSGVQSGTCVIDYHNTSGLSPDPATPPMVAFWSTCKKSTQNISYSLDHGRTWKIYDKNPVLAQPDRDPKVFWYEPTKSWVMFLFVQEKYHVFTSKNLLNWEDAHSEIGNSHECPDFFQLPVDGDKTKMKWVLIRGNGGYSLGEFDGVKFTEETGLFRSDSGPNFYATQTWENTSTGDGRRAQLAWMNGGPRPDGYPNMPFNQQMSFPRELTLRTTPAGPRLFREPIREIASLHGAEDEWHDKDLAKGTRMDIRSLGQTFHIQAEVRVPKGSTLQFHLNGSDLNVRHAQIDSNSVAEVADEVTYVEILVDRTSIEGFANHGEACVSRCILPFHDGISIECKDGPATLKSLKVFDLHSAWKGVEKTETKP